MEKKKKKKKKKRKKLYPRKISRLLSKSLSPAHRSIHDQRNFVLINPTQFQPETAGWRKIFRQIIRPSILDTGWRRTGVISSSSGLFRHVRRRIRAEVTFQGLYRGVRLLADRLETEGEFSSEERERESLNAFETTVRR